MTVIIEGREIPENLKELVRPEHTAVVVHDMQNDLVAPGGTLSKAGLVIKTSHFLPSLVQFVKAARENGVKIMYTNYTNLPDFVSLPASIIYKNLNAFKGPPGRNPFVQTLAGTWGWQTIDELAPQEKDVIISKYRVDSFVGTNFELVLRSSGVKTIVHAGIATDRGILPTAIHAFNLGFFTIVPEDCVSGGLVNRHDEAMKIIREFSTVISSSEIMDAWSR